MEWMKQIRTGRTRLMKVSKTTKNSIFIEKIRPFLAQHL